MTLCSFILIGLSACQTPQFQAAMPTLASVPNVRLQATQMPVALATRELRAVPSATLTPSAQPSATPTCLVDTRNPRPQHRVQSVLHYAEKRLEVQQIIAYQNTTRTALNEIVLVVEPAMWRDSFLLQHAKVDGVALEHELLNNRLSLRLPQTLMAGCRLEIDLAYRLNLPRIGQGIAAYKGYYGYSERQINLALWLAKLAPYGVNGWTVHEWANIGEQLVLEQADWDLTLTVPDAPEGLVVAVPGLLSQVNSTTWRSQLSQARDLSLSLSPFYRLLQESTPSGVSIEMYAFSDTLRDGVDGAQHALSEARKSYQQYEALFGASPYQRILVIQGDFPDGMEFSGIVFVSTNWFYQWRGGYDNFLTVITVHEISHQWWYARVGNDAAFAPWLDEALATYSEYIYYEEYHPELREWWWSFRVGYYAPQGKVDSSVYEFLTPRDYINAVYLRGVQMLHNLRENVGTEAFFKLLEDYVKAADGRIATPRLFWSLLTPEQYFATRDTRGQFLNLPDVLADPSARP